MARPFLNTFEKDSPMSPQAAAANISYQANVSRQKTKKWAEAKAVDYGGDDWGDDDEYGYDPPSPPPATSKSMGPRQYGQASSSFANTPTVDSNRKYGDLPALPGASGRGRSNSFDADDERRNFSSSTIRQDSLQSSTSPQFSNPQQSSAPATRFSQITGVPTIRNPSGPPTLSISTQQPTQSVPQQRNVTAPVAVSSYSTNSPYSEPRGRANMSDAPPITPSESGMVTPSTASDFHVRRDFSPSAVVPPLTTRAPVSSQSPVDGIGTRFPARKSSLSQVTGPPLEEIMQSSGQPSRSIMPESTPVVSPRSPITSPGKALPFVRPADIYKRRMEEEQERQRTSMDSSRPSMDSVTAIRSGNPLSPDTPHLNDKVSSESLGGGRRMSNDSDVAADSGRRLMPMLDTVKERRSEYGFEGVNFNDPELRESPQTASRPNEIDSDKGRSLDVSPKLPDLNRMSGFGMDMFTHPGQSSARESEPAPPDLAAILNLPRNQDPTLKSQSSFGFRSVVSQAFDTAEPETPASASVKRSDSESTGTTGISPIISRASSSAMAGSRQPEMSILEVVNEPNSPESTHEASSNVPHERGIPGFIPGHRRDISAPSPGNSPARTPDLGVIPSISTTEQHAEVDITSPVDDSPNDDQGLHATRPTADREASFRPSLPGGWTSYATTEVPSRSISRKQTPAPQPLETSQSPAEEDELTPTTSKQWLPKAEFDSTIIGATDSQVAGGSSVEHDLSAPSPVPVSRSLHNVSSQERDSEPVKTFDPVAAFDPSTHPKLEQAPAETQLRPDVVNRAVSHDASIAPTPPPKDTSRMESMTSDAGYFQNTSLSLEHHTSQYEEEEESDGEWDSPTREAIPIINTGTPTSDDGDEDENERLREEIVKSLSPRPSDAALVPDEHDSGVRAGQSRESTYLPSEYDNYWASTGDDRSPPLTATGSQQVDRLTTHALNAAPIAPLSPQRSVQSSLEPPRPSLQNRFSWEQSAEQIPTMGYETETGRGSVDHASMAGHPSELPAKDVNTISELDASSAYPPALPAVGHEKRDISNEISSGGNPSHDGRDLGVAAGVIAGAGLATAAYAHTQSDGPQRRMSLAEEKSPLATSTSYPVSPTPPEDEHPSRSPQPYFPLTTDSFSPAPPSTVSPVDTPTQQQFPPTNKLLGFKDIMAIPSTEKRIETFNSTRQYWASIDTGLNDWIARLQSQNPEFADVTGTWSGSRSGVPSSSIRSKFPKSGGTAPPLQQPYYQQYLNASPTTTSPSTPTSAGPPPATSFQPSGQQGFAPGGSKLTTQQVQAKGKELLHTAGIFGGKAGKAGKGFGKNLLAKGKDRLRGADKGEKTIQASPTSSPSFSKPKNERRSSWGFPLSLSRSSNRNDTSSRHSRDSTATPTFQRSRAATTTSWDDSPAKGMSPLPVNQSHGFMSGALPPEPQHSLPQVAPISPPISTVRQVVGQLPSNSSPNFILNEDDAVSLYEPDEGPVLGKPAPISKDQPSWDAINAAPISEESSQAGGSRVSYEEQNLRLPLPVDVGNASSTGRSNSDETNFYDANEEPAENSDWVMVPSQHDSKDTLLKEEPVLITKNELGHDSSHVNSMHVPDTKVKEQQTPEREIPKQSPSSPTSIINRPRGSSYDYPLPALSPQTSRFSSGPSASRTIPTTAPRTSIDLPASAPVPQQPVAKEQDQHDQYAQKQNASASFLPPIRRTSTFAFPFGSRHANPQLPAEREQHATAAPLTRIQSIPSPVAHSIASYPTVSPIETDLPPVQYPNQNAPLDGPLQYRRANGQISPRNSQHQRVQSLPEPEAPMPSTLGQVSPLNNFVQNRSGGETAYPFHQRVQSLPENQPQQSGQQGRVLPQASSSSYETSIPQQEPQRAQKSVSKPITMLTQAEFEESHVEWRPSRSSVSTIAPTSPSEKKEMNLPHRRINSWESGVEQDIIRKSWSQVPEPQWDEKPAGPPPQQRPYEQPPSSAQRYPELFRPGQVSPNDPRQSVDLPAQYYQAPISRAAAFLPRQQTNEYQLHGVGPPEPPLVGTPRRNSGFFNDIGGKISRRSSRERRRSASLSRGDASNAVSNERPLSNRQVPVQHASPASVANGTMARETSYGNEYADSIAPSEAAQERQRKRRSSLLGGVFNRSTSGSGVPVGQENTAAHSSASRDELPRTPPSPVVKEEKKRSLFGSSNLGPSPKNGKLSKESTTSNSTADTATKKNRFSGLSSIFGKRSSSSARPIPQHQSQAQSTRELAQNERQPLESPVLLPAQRRSNRPAAPVIDNRSASQSRSSFNNLAHSSSSLSSPAKEKKPRRPSASGLLGGLIGRKSNTDRGSEDARSQGSTSSRTVRPLQLAQTYSDLNDEVTPSPAPQPRVQQMPNQAIANQHMYGHRTFDERFPDQKLAVQPAERGRLVSKEQQRFVEPQYDSVPIPGGYSLVQGQGATRVHSDYDPRGINQQSQQQGYGSRTSSSGPQHRQQPQQNQRNYPQTTAAPRSMESSLPKLPQHLQESLMQYRQQPARLDINNIPAHHNHLSNSPHLSREDLLARSPPMSLDGQQRPYQISLPPGDDDDEELTLPLRKDPINPSSAHPAAKTGRVDAIRQFQQPTLRHPESPAGYPLPKESDEVFSPVVGGVNDMPPPPPPKWPSALERHLQEQEMQIRHVRQQSLGVEAGDGEMERSNTRRTAVSAVSNVSGEEHGAVPMGHHNGSGLNVPGQESVNGGGNGRGRATSLTPPSPMMGTPVRGLSPESAPLNPVNPNRIRTTEVQIPQRQTSAEDLYDASPRLPKAKIDSGNAMVVQTQNLGQQVQEEKIHYAGGRGENLRPGNVPAGEGEERAGMSATSYPGQEWNPYMAGGWDEGYD